MTKYLPTTRVYKQICNKRGHTYIRNNAFSSVRTRVAAWGPWVAAPRGTTKSESENAPRWFSELWLGNDGSDEDGVTVYNHKCYTLAAYVCIKWGMWRRYKVADKISMKQSKSIVNKPFLVYIMDKARDIHAENIGSYSTPFGREVKPRVPRWTSPGLKTSWDLSSIGR